MESTVSLCKHLFMFTKGGESLFPTRLAQLHPKFRCDVSVIIINIIIYECN